MSISRQIGLVTLLAFGAAIVSSAHSLEPESKTTQEIPSPQEVKKSLWTRSTSFRSAMRRSTR